MKRIRWAVLAVAGTAWVGCAIDPGECCDRFSPGEERGIYCNAHKDAVIRYVEGTRDRVEQQQRLEWFKGVFKELEPLADSDAIHDRLSRFEATRPDFWTQYDRQHFWAGRDTSLGLEERGRLMVCGFRHAIRDLQMRIP